MKNIYLEKTFPLSTLTSEDRGNDLNGMPEFSTIERIVELKQLAEEKLQELHPDSREALIIRQALGELEEQHWIADNHDSSNQCSDRQILRSSFKRF